MKTNVFCHSVHDASICMELKAVYIHRLHGARVLALDQQLLASHLKNHHEVELATYMTFGTLLFMPPIPLMISPPTFLLLM